MANPGLGTRLLALLSYRFIGGPGRLRRCDRGRRAVSRQRQQQHGQEAKDSCVITQLDLASFVRKPSPEHWQQQGGAGFRRRWVNFEQKEEKKSNVRKRALRQQERRREAMQGFAALDELTPLDFLCNGGREGEWK